MKWLRGKDLNRSACLACGAESVLRRRCPALSTRLRSSIRRRVRSAPDDFRQIWRVEIGASATVLRRRRRRRTRTGLPSIPGIVSLPPRGGLGVILPLSAVCLWVGPSDLEAAHTDDRMEMELAGAPRPAGAAKQAFSLA
jgi:hypothetical protein